LVFINSMKTRENWGSKLGFLMATAGSAIGLGSLWKFPYVTGENGGGYFVLAYLIFTLMVGIPIFIAELLIGRSASKAPVGAFTDLSKGSPAWRMLGWSCGLATLLILSYYSVVAGWALNYALMSLLNFTQGKTPEEISNVFNLLYISGDINLLGNFVFLVITTGIVYLGIRQGIEFWSKILTPSLLVILIVLFLYATTLDGFREAFYFIFIPKAERLTPSALLQALGLSCFTLSVGMGIIITYGSYMRSHDDIPKTSLTIAAMTILVSLLASLMIFPIIFTFNFPPQEGPGLLFKSLPVLFSQLPGTLLISTVFFILVVFAALTSTISVMEVLVATVTEVFGWSRGKGVLIVALLVFILGIPSALSGSGGLFDRWAEIYGKNFFETMDDFATTWLLPVNAILTSLFAGWVMDRAIARESFLKGSNLVLLFRPWLFLLRWIVPVGVILIMLQQGGLVDFDKLVRGLTWQKAQ
jgi:neurotransmitter:Na+ symporter, NSS family